MGPRPSRVLRPVALALVAVLAAGAAAGAAVIQLHDVRITVLSQIMPFELPRHGTAPIAVFLAGHLENPHGGVPPQLQRLMIEVNRHGILRAQGLPTCRIEQIQAVSTEQALKNCRSALVGSGQFWANVIFSGQPPYATRGRLLIFNGRKRGRPALFAQIYTENPFNSSFVIPFSIGHLRKGSYGTRLTASLPAALGSWGYLNRIKLNLKRRYFWRGRHLSYFNAGCPAPGGASRTLFPLARLSFYFADRPKISVTMSKACGVKE
jgi:hypothetical protein